MSYESDMRRHMEIVAAQQQLQPLDAAFAQVYGPMVRGLKKNRGNMSMKKKTLRPVLRPATDYVKGGVKQRIGRG